MAGYDITQVNIPGLLGMHQQMKQQRLVDLYRAKEFERLERADEKDLKVSGLLAQLLKGRSSGAEPPVSNVTAAPVSDPVTSPPIDTSIPTGSPLSPARFPDAPPVVDAPPIAPIAATPAQPRLDPEIFSQLVALNPEQAFKIADHFDKMDERERKASKDKYAVMGSAAAHLMSFPQGGRMQAMHQLAPQLIAAGFKPEELQNIDLSDAGLQGYSALSMDVDKIINLQSKDRDYAFDREKFDADERYRAQVLSQGGQRLDLAERREGRVAGGGVGSYEYRVSPATGQLQKRKAR